MPGVPSGRGCEACRKQKKKCVQAKGSCSRCSRLGIPCVGGGQRRYKFIEDPLVTVVPQSQVRSRNQLPNAIESGILASPSSGMTLTTSALISALNVTDIRYDLNVYGEFFKDIPKRLGSHTALDASVKAFTTCLTPLYSRQESPEALESYGHALKALRDCLNDPSEVGSGNTLCAIYLIMICQGWVAQKDDRTSHGEVLVHLLSAAASQSRQDGFEADLMTALCVPVIIESIVNPRVKIGVWLEKLTETRDRSVGTESLKLINLAKIPKFIRNPIAHVLDIQASYRQMALDTPNLKQILLRLSEGPNSMRGIRCYFQTAYIMVVAFAIVLNHILRSFEPADVALLQESFLLADEIIAVAEDASQYRPLGASAMPLFLIAAWVSTDDMIRREKVEFILAQYQTDFSSANWKDMAVRFDSELQKRCFAAPGSIPTDMRMLEENVRSCCLM